MTSTIDPIIPTPAWHRAVKASFWGTPDRNPDLISLNEVADSIGIKRESMSTNVCNRPMWFPFDVVTTARSANGGNPTRYYRRSEVEPWIRQYVRRADMARKRARIAQDATNAPKMTQDSGPHATSVRTGEMRDPEQEAA